MTAGSAARPTAVSSFFDLYDTKNTLYDIDRRRRPSPRRATLFKTMTGVRPVDGRQRRLRVQAHDRRGRTATAATTTPAGTGCTAGTDRRRRQRHGLPPAYHVDRSGEPDRTSRTRRREQLRALRRRSGGTPRIYGLGAMEMFTPLPPAAGDVLGVLPRPDRRGPRRQDDGDHALGPGRHQPPGARSEIRSPTAAGWAPATTQLVGGPWDEHAATRNVPALSGQRHRRSTRRPSAAPQHVQRLLADHRRPAPDRLQPPSRAAGGRSSTRRRHRARRSTSRPGRSEISGNPVHLVLPYSHPSGGVFALRPHRPSRRVIRRLGRFMSPDDRGRSATRWGGISSGNAST